MRMFSLILKTIGIITNNKQMKKIILIPFISIIFTFYTTFQSEVYICKGGSSKVYHKSESCRGLKFCSTKVEKVSEEDAIKLGRRKCKLEK